MKKNFLLIGAFCLATFAACDADRRTAQNEGYQDTEEVTGQETVVTTDPQSNRQLEDETREFLQNTASANMMEVELGKIAQEKANRQEVKDFAGMMVQDHSQATERLKSIAQNKNIQLPDSMKQEHRDRVERFRNLSGQEFDKEYVNLMVEEHEKDVDKFEDMQDDVQDQELKQWVNNTLETLRQHKQRIEQINNNMEQRS